MEHKKRNAKKIFAAVACLCCLGILTSTISGCSSLRRKFTRKSKEDKEDSRKVMPILEPMDYPQKVYSPLERYKYHYSLWKVWERDFVQAIESDGSDKRQKYLLNQAVEQLEGMNALLIDEKKGRFALLIEELRSIQQVYEKPVAMRNTFSIKKAIERNAREIRNNFAPDPSLFDPQE